ncbi:MAG: hypothetical protein CL908_26800 [Deltaproteobacteria bacterium]|nr:hypothetical protein [Deltaproteobacteria bacterium]
MPSSIPSATDHDLLARLDRNFRLASAETFASSEIGEALKTRDVHCVMCPLAEFNWAFLKFPNCDAEKAVDRAERYYGERELPFRLIVRSDLAAATGAADILANRGHIPVGDPTPGMSIQPLGTTPAPPEGLEIRRVDGETSLAQFSHTVFAGFGIPTRFSEKFLTADLLASPEAALFVGYVEDEPVATTMMIATGDVAGIYWVATLEDHRRRGYAEALTWAGLAAGRELGCRVGSLQASAMGRPVYARMGFGHTADYVY